MYDGLFGDTLKLNLNIVMYPVYQHINCEQLLEQVMMHISVHKPQTSVNQCMYVNKIIVHFVIHEF